MSNNKTDCDKCGGPVLPENDAIEFARFYSKEPETADYDGDTPILGLNNARSRHLFPVTEGSSIVCEGSPSRAQYVGGARDTRVSGGDRYDEFFAPGFTRAFEKFRAVHPVTE